MKNNKVLLCTILVIVTNILSIVFVKNYTEAVSYKETAYAYEEMISQYPVDIDKFEIKKVQQVLIMQYIVEISNYGKVDKDYTYLCKAWNRGLDEVIRKNFTLEKDIYNSYISGAKKIDEICIHNSNYLNENVENSAK